MPIIPETGGRANRARPRVAFFGHDCTESTVIKRARAFDELGLEVLGFTFRRRKFNRDYVPEWNDVNLGVTTDRRYGPRLLRLAVAAAKLVRERRRLARADFFYARNIDMCALALFARMLARSRAPVVYEVLDVQGVFTDRGPLAFLFRLAERLVLARTALLVVSSPAFISRYFAPVQGYAWPWFLLENKISGLDEVIKSARCAPERGQRPAFPPDGPWVLAWLGNLRCPKSPHLLRNIARALGDRVRIHVHGYPTETGLEHFLGLIEGCDNLVYFGEYRSPADLPGIYHQAHFAWAFDYLDEGANSAWLLPNRLYEGCYFGTPALAAEGSESGRRIKEHGLGWTLEEPVDQAVVELLETLEAETYLGVRRHLLDLPDRLFLDEGDTAELCRRVLQQRHRATETEATDVVAAIRRAGL